MSVPALSIEFDHSVGINNINNGVICHPNGNNYIFSSGGNAVIGDLVDPASQVFMKRYINTRLFECRCLTNADALNFISYINGTMYSITLTGMMT